MNMDDPSRQTLRYVYFTLQLIGGAGLVALFTTLAFPSPVLRRYPTLILLSLCISWIISTVGACLLFFAQQLTGPQPSPELCLAQSVFVIAQPPMTSVSTLAFVLHVWLVLTKEIDASTAPRIWKSVLLLSAPYIVFLVFAFVVLHIGYNHPDLVSRHIFYCSLDVRPVTLASAAFTALVLLVAIAFCLWIAVILKRHFTKGVSSSEDGLMSNRLRIRVVLFGFYLLLGLGLSGAALSDFTSVIPDMFVATNGIAILAIFGSQREVLRTWQGCLRWLFCSCCRRSPHDSESEDEENQVPQTSQIRAFNSLDSERTTSSLLRHGAPPGPQRSWTESPTDGWRGTPTEGRTGSDSPTIASAPTSARRTRGGSPTPMERLASWIEVNASDADSLTRPSPAITRFSSPALTATVLTGTTSTTASSPALGSKKKMSSPSPQMHQVQFRFPPPHLVTIAASPRTSSPTPQAPTTPTRPRPLPRPQPPSHSRSQTQPLPSPPSVPTRPDRPLSGPIPPTALYPNPSFRQPQVPSPQYSASSFSTTLSAFPATPQHTHTTPSLRSNPASTPSIRSQQTPPSLRSPQASVPSLRSQRRSPPAPLRSIPEPYGVNLNRSRSINSSLRDPSVREDDFDDSGSVEFDLPRRPSGGATSPLEEMLGIRSDWVGKAF